MSLVNTIGGLATLRSQSGILDVINVPAACAVSLRLLRLGYTGPVVQVRRNSDLLSNNFIADINGNLSNVQNGTTLQTFLSATTGNVLTLYDQSGNGRNFSGGSNYPRIYQNSNVGLQFTMIAANGGYSGLSNGSMSFLDQADFTIVVTTSSAAASFTPNEGLYSYGVGSSWAPGAPTHSRFALLKNPLIGPGYNFYDSNITTPALLNSGTPSSFSSIATRITRTGGTMFYNGALVSSNSSGTWFTGANKQVQIFRVDFYGGGPEMGEFIIFPSALTPDQISSIYRNQLSLPIPRSGLTGTSLFSQLSPAATSSAVGAFSLRAVNGVTAKAVQVVWSGVASLPPAAMSGFGPQTLSGYTYGGGGSYTVAESSHGGGSFAWQVFDKNITTQWNTNFTYTGPGTNNANTYIVNTYSTTVAGSPVYGEWIEIRMPTAVYPYSYTLTPPTNGLQLGFPYQWTLVGSNDNGITWISVDTQNGINTWTSLTPKTFVSASRSTAYSYYRLIIQAVNSYSSATNQIAQLVEWTINGFSPSWTQDFYADRLGNLLTAPVTGQPLADWLGGATGYVVTWYDQSGAGNHATQAIVANQPIIQKATKGPGYSCLFNGTTNYMNFGSSTILNGTNYSVCANTRRNVSGSQKYYVGSNGAGGANQNLSVGYYTDASIIINEGAYATGATVPAYSAGSEPTGYDFVMMSQSSGMYAFSFRSGTSYSGGGSTLTTPLNTAGVGIIGAVATNGTYAGYFSGEIFELNIFTTSLFDLSGSIIGQLTPIPSIIQTIYQNQFGYTGA